MTKKILFAIVLIAGWSLIAQALFAQVSLSKTEAAKISKDLMDKRRAELESQYDEQWAYNELIYDKYMMPFYFRISGKEPAEGRAMYISMHGGGGAPKDVNDQQWKNQKLLYTPAEGLYFVPRAPTDSWNMWHQSHIDTLFSIAIEMAMIKYHVNPNKVYIMGYSAGGDGTFQLAPRLADYFAAAAMSAGHPGDAQIRSLRNVPFSIFMGEQDAAYNRNQLAHVWSGRLDSLQNQDPQGYEHFVSIYPQYSHWMERADTISMEWMPRYKRNPIPEKVVWVQDDVLRSRFYWLQVDVKEVKQNDCIVARYSQKGVVEIEESSVPHFFIELNDRMMDLDKAVTIKYKGKNIYKGKAVRAQKNIAACIQDKYDQDLIFPSKFSINLSGKKPQVSPVY